MRSPVLARAWFAVTVLVVVAALVLQVPITADAPAISFETPLARVANLFCFFTVLSNLLLAGVSAVLVVRPHASSTAFRVLRLGAVVSIAVTGLVHHAVLAGLTELRGAEQLADQLFHTASPLLGVLGWLLFGPRGATSVRVVLLSLLYPVGWLLLALVRGAAIDYYPYPFLDVSVRGYASVALSCVVVAALFLALATGVSVVDRRWRRGESNP